MLEALADAERSADGARRGKIRIKRRHVGTRATERHAESRSVGAGCRHARRIGEVGVPVGNRHGAADADELCFAARQARRIDGRREKLRRGAAAELANATAQNPRLRNLGLRLTGSALEQAGEAATTSAAATPAGSTTAASTAATSATAGSAARRSALTRPVATTSGVGRKPKRKREANARTDASVRRNAIGAKPELAFDVGVVRRLSIDGAAFTTQTIRELECTVGAPDVAEIDGAGHRTTRPLGGRKRPRELAGAVGVEVGQREELKVAVAVGAGRRAKTRAVEEPAQLPAMLAAPGEPRQFVAHLELVRGIVVGQGGVAAEVEVRKAHLAAGKRAAHEHASLGEAQVRVGAARVERVRTLELVEKLPDDGRQRHQPAHAAAFLFTGVGGNALRRAAKAVEQAARHVGAQRQRVGLVELLVEANDAGEVVGGAVIRHERVAQRQAVALEQREEARRRIGLHVQRLERLRARAKERLKRIDAPP